MRTEKVVVIIPTYNEALVIEETLRQVFQTITSLPNVLDLHVLVFDSASTDNTEAIVTTLQTRYPNLHLLTEAKKSGLGSAYLQAMRYALDHLSADIIVEFDADLSHQPQYLAPMLKRLKTCDVVLGSRYVKHGKIPGNWGWHRKFLSVLGNYVARFILTTQYKDFTSGFRATRREALQKVLPEKFLSNHYAYKLELLWLLHQSKANIQEYPIEFIDRQQGVSKLPANSILDSLRVIFSLRFQQLITYFKMCLVGLSGMLVQYVLYNLLRQTLPPVSAIQFAVLGAMLNNFALNNRFTFKKHALNLSYRTLKSLFFFMTYSILMIAVQSYSLKFGIQYYGTGFVTENIILFCSMLLGSLLNYFIYSQFIWKKR